jgi:hypothetical protein
MSEPGREIPREIQIQVALARIIAKLPKILAKEHSVESQVMDLEHPRGRLGHGWDQIGRIV